MPMRILISLLVYQYLEAIDVETYDDIKKGKIFMLTKTAARRVKLSDMVALESFKAFRKCVI
jgi:hypothetical protein